MSQYQAIISSRLPWDTYPGEENRMRALMLIILVLVLLLFFVLPHVKIPEVDRHKVVVDTELAKYAVELKKLPPPAPPKPQVQPKKEEAKKTATEQVKPQEQVEPAEPKPVAQDAKVQAARAAAKKQMEAVGLADLPDVNDSIGDTATPGPGGLPGMGNGAIGGDQSTDQPGADRALLTSHAGGGGGGGFAAGGSGHTSVGFSAKVGKGGTGGNGGNGLGPSGGQLAKVQSSLGEAKAQSSTMVVGHDGKAHRSDENIRSIFDTLQGRLYGAYQKALRDNPNLGGNVVLKLVIQPDGTVTTCEVASSDLGDAQLESRLVTIVKSANFGSQPVEIWTGTHTLALLAQ